MAKTPFQYYPQAQDFDRYIALFDFASAKPRDSQYLRSVLVLAFAGLAEEQAKPRDSQYLRSVLVLALAETGGGAASD